VAKALVIWVSDIGISRNNSVGAPAVFAFGKNMSLVGGS
jgi:hypothetical protein